MSSPSPKAHGVPATVTNYAVAEKGIMFFGHVDQAMLRAAAGVPIRSSTLPMFGNPALGVQFLAGDPLARLDWLVRLLAIEDASGRVWTAFTDFAWIAYRHHIADRDAVSAVNGTVRAR